MASSASSPRPRLAELGRELAAAAPPSLTKEQQIDRLLRAASAMSSCVAPSYRARRSRPAAPRTAAFLVEACWFLADELVKAWTRERKRELVAGAEDVTLVARRLIAQRCLDGVDNWRARRQAGREREPTTSQADAVCREGRRI